MAQVAYSPAASPRWDSRRDARASADAGFALAFEEPDAAPAGRRPAPPYPSAMRRARRRARLTVLASVAAAAAAGWAVLAEPPGGAPAPTRPVASAEAPVPARPAPPRPDIAWMLDPTPALGVAAALADAAPPAPAFRIAAVPSAPAPVAAAHVAPAEPVAAIAQAPVREPVRVAAATPAAVTAPGPVAALVPLPVARPPELRRPQVVPATRVAGRQPLPRTRDVFRAAMAEEPSFLERLFGGGPAETAPRTTGALAYADPDAVAAPRPRLVPGPSASPSASPSAATAVYDITAGTVTLPGGEVLEAHSGYGAMMDDPRYAHVRMRGPTPPGTYDLTERERPFHGVRAIRMTPVGGSAAIHGRDGILAHTYMLRQPGASNGCVVFRDYPRFLNAFLRGEVRRMVVVAGGRGDFFGSARRIADR
ncbi:DUF2778 domain-containing protein [Methylobacterium sp. NEAU 140]|uniref:DUF2778 domain-containing protein n=1 Tax=Methylobacterium sp. NEAU 140 TaxID=3064945 RepID=UPI0027325A54|nr:DUF2778 domain-containing protein [Methylobacterium sp. NEAU 140]MDP4025955.1 DUF2778 domain-containing protein [Methylobacterium sp. NEAU 140]